MDKREYLRRLYTEIDSKEDISDYLYLEFCLSAQERGLNPFWALKEHGMTCNELVADDWGIFLNQELNGYVSAADVKRTSPLIAHNGKLTLVELDQEEVE